MGKVNSVAEDYPQETLVSLADEILAILKSSESEIDKKVNVETLLREKIPQEIFLDLINIAKQITDYEADPDEREQL